MNRREALARVSILFGGTIVGANAFLTGCTPKTNDGAATNVFSLSSEQMALLDEIGETILPATKALPGAKATAIGNFMNTIVLDCYTPQEQKVFNTGIQSIQNRAEEKFSKSFVELMPAERLVLLSEIDIEAAEIKKSKKDEVHYFEMMKQLTIWGYFTSEIGCTKALRYNPVPGRYQGDIPYKKGDRAWSDI